VKLKSKSILTGLVWLTTTLVGVPLVSLAAEVTEAEATNIAKGFVRFQGEQVLAQIYLANEIITAAEAVIIN